TDERVRVEDRTVPGPPGAPEVAVRVYTPRALEAPGAGVVFFHGGAFILGDVYTEELRCLRYAAGARCVVVSVGYRLAPEDPFPAAPDDGYAALVWTAEHAGALGIDPGRLAVAGSSAGGALAAATALRARDAGGPTLAFQLLNYPVIDDRLATPSMRTFDATPLWTSGASALMWDYYLGPVEGRGPVSPYAAPGRAEDLGGLPPALVVAAELDPLRDEGLDYGRRLLEAGVPTELHCYRGACHGFDIIATATAIGRRALDEQVAALERGLATPG
ncbi:MAG TPA: alpha/beta hydrolase, partial [Acidimicrobiales bacterium]|nr:alpha/beta hydrolase [Acidimicrobiales bacterium]